MPVRKLRLIPGVNVEKTPTLNEAGYSYSSLGRFFAGLFQPIGGWTALISGAAVGVVRALHGWADLSGVPYLAVGSEQRLQVDIGGVLSDVTPVYLTTNPAPAFTTFLRSNTVLITDAGASPSIGDWIDITVPVAIDGVSLSGFYQVAAIQSGTQYAVELPSPQIANSATGPGGQVPIFATANGSSTITVTLANHGLFVGAVFNVIVSVTVGGLTLSGLYNVATVPNSSSFTFAAASAATSNATATQNGGNTQIQYLIKTGAAEATALAGYGLGDFGAGDFGLTGSSGPIVEQLRSWSLDNFGQDLIASPRNGSIYFWQPPNVGPASVVSSDAPVNAIAVFVMSQAQIVIAIGAEHGGQQFPLLVRWCDLGNFQDWTASATNQAGSYQLPTGSTCVAGVALGLGALIWTDTGLWSMTYEGLPFVFGFNPIGTSCETISARAPVVIGNVVVWVSTRGWFRYDGGGVRPMEVPVWDFFFENFDATQPDQVFGWLNTPFNTVQWHFPVIGGGMAYVEWNYLDNIWLIGPTNSMPRTAGIDRSPVGLPISADTASNLQQHETSNTANGSPITATMRTGYFDLSDGDEYVLVDMVIPDFLDMSASGQAAFTFLTQDYPNDTPRVSGPFVVTSAVKLFTTRVRGRQMAIQIDLTDQGGTPRLGAVRYRAIPDGSR